MPSNPPPAPALPADGLTSQSASTVRQAIHNGRKCLVCNSEKRPGFYFCGDCYNRLPADMKSMLFNIMDNAELLNRWAKLYNWLMSHLPRRAA